MSYRTATVARLAGGPGVADRRERIVLVVAWLVGLAAIGAWIVSQQHGAWDFKIYCDTIEALRRGHDPYGDALAAQAEFHRTLAQHPSAIAPYSYLYPPITFPLLRLAGALPAALSATIYWVVYSVSAVVLLWVGLQAASTGERRFFVPLAPFALFFPGLLQHDAVLSGNVAIILYGLVLGAAVVGWRQGRWTLFYLAVIVAACFKPPLLTLVAIPLLSARRQLWASAAACACGVLLFAIQPLLWPSLFRSFVHTIAVESAYRRELGCSPAGLLSGFLVAHGIAYSPWSAVFYVAYASVIFAALWVLSRRFVAGRLAFGEFMPVLLVGVILLNPRIMQYDTLPLTVPMLLLAWRVLRQRMTRTWTVATMCALFAVANIIAAPNLERWKDIEGPLLVVIFVGGCWRLLRGAGELGLKPIAIRGVYSAD